ncbi:OmpA family protein [Aeromonas veronii]|uniref:OmpA family protein n=1 Tax=Aeromonas veronii TaxID=654 RepID=UPI00226CECC7|nr:OmpA family protein [Aeromonas veronii]MCX9104421.1 OmpA family protein [Aeromonas veronii]MCX9120072.1 OmpA family protein [Aeromonas veronii]
MDKSFRLAPISCVLIVAVGCSSQQMQNFKSTVNNIGKDYGMPVLCGAGIIAGGAAGYALNGKKGAVAGGAIGGALGCAAGYMWQSRLQELDRIAKEENLNIATEKLTVAEPSAVTGVPQDAGLVAQIPDSGMFAIGSAQLTESGLRVVTKLAQLYSKPAAADASNARRILLVGHSDATGPAELNLRLSEQRARAVGKILVASGIPASSIYYQGAGSSRPIADNSDPLLRGQNRRVEIVELANEQALVMRAQSEESNTRYLRYGTSETAKPRVAATRPAAQSASGSGKVTATSQTAPRQTTAKQSAPDTSMAKAAPNAKAAVDFGGKPAETYQWNMAQNIKPKASGFALISSAYASDMPMSSCEADKPRSAGQVLSMADDKPLPRHATKEYMPGYNNRVWANTVNGHLVTVSPVSILRDNAKVDRQPILQVVQGYKSSNQKKPQTLKAVANTYEGESEVLYRVFTSDPKASVSCMDLVFSKGNAQVSQGALFYPAGSEAYVASYKPIPATHSK